MVDIFTQKTAPFFCRWLTVFHGWK